ncbi:helix-turn-helix domain-containing protein [Niallia taxi]|uniref:helix-turn-helix domain-containing protein n=1 Tax=Niallia taxi TaxID=2499688 RepID=UPI0021A7A68D|nr:helix-turn-helix transcriptional regulator [Niallia taxi]MCT2342650.1 helix-turn-helix domain-containing protein [Niallia taxi]
MATIWDFIKNNPSERPKYTRYELAKLVKEERISKQLSTVDLANKYNVDSSLWESIENGSRTFNVKIYNLISDFLGIEKSELLKKEVDDLSGISYRSTANHDDVEEAIMTANLIFDEIIMQEKIGAN